MKKDQGYAYVVLVALICTGTLQALNVILSGLFMIEYSKRYHVSTDRIIWVVTARRLVGVSGVLIGSFNRRFGYRTLGLCGTCFVVLGNVTSAFYPRIEILYVTYGLISGFGYQCMVTATVTTTQYYFDKRKALATGLLWAGTSTGAILFPPLFQYFYTYFGLQSALLFEACIVMQSFISFSLMRPFEDDNEDHKPTNQQTHMHDIGNTNLGFKEDGSIGSDVYTKVIPSLAGNTMAHCAVDHDEYKQQVFAIKKNLEPQQNEVEKDSMILSNGKSIEALDVKCNVKYSETGNKCIDCTQNFLCDESANSHQPSLTTHNADGSIDYILKDDKVQSSKRNSNVSFNETLLNANIGNYNRSSAISLEKPSDTFQKLNLTAVEYRRKSSAISLDVSINSRSDRRQSIGNISVAESVHIKNTLVLFPTEKGYKELFKNIPFWIQCIGCNIAVSGYMQTFILIPYKAIEVGETPQRAASLMSILGILSLTMRLLGGFVSDLPIVKDKKGFLAGFQQLSSGAITILVPFINNFTWLGLYAGTWGFVAAYQSIVFPSVLFSMVGPRNFAIALGTIKTFSAVSICVITVAVGYLMEEFGRSRECFLFSGATQIAGGTLMLISVITHKYMNKTYQVHQK